MLKQFYKFFIYKDLLKVYIFNKTTLKINKFDCETIREYIIWSDSRPQEEGQANKVNSAVISNY